MRTCLMSRRDFALTLTFASLLREAAFGAPFGRSRLRLVTDQEPGQRLEIDGRIFRADRVTPIAGARLDVYQTDAAGFYNAPKNDPRAARIKGSVWTDSEGRYTIVTVRPGHNADVNPPPPAHIHVHLAADGMPDHWIDSFVFADDPLANPATREKNQALGRFSAMLTPTAANGARQCRRDIVADPALAARNYLVNGWYRN